MKTDLITAGQFAKLAWTTKRTILWYDQKGILKPTKIDQSGYRFYQPRQIIDFQVILLLRKLRFSIEEIKAFLKKSNSLKSLFEIKRKVVEQEINSLQLTLENINDYYINLDRNGTLVKPKIKKVKPIWVYYIDKVGAYAKTADYGSELHSYFKKLPKPVTYLTLFMDEGYRPHKSAMKIALVAKKGMQLKPQADKVVKEMLVPGYKALTYIHYGPGSLLSLLWKELEKYGRLNKFRLDLSLPFCDLEFYRPPIGVLAEEEVFFEIHLPIQ